jgi:hypothetical protein
MLETAPHGSTNDIAALIPTADKNAARPIDAYRPIFCAFSPMTIPQSTANSQKPYARCHAVAMTPKM